MAVAKSCDNTPMLQLGKIRPLTYSEDEGEVFLGHSVTQHKQVSDDTANAIDEEVRRIIDTNYERARTLLEEHVDKLHAMAKALIKYETINVTQIKDIMEGRELNGRLQRAIAL